MTAQDQGRPLDCSHRDGRLGRCDARGFWGPRLASRGFYLFSRVSARKGDLHATRHYSSRTQSAAPRPVHFRRQGLTLSAFIGYCRQHPTKLFESADISEKKVSSAISFRGAARRDRPIRLRARYLSPNARIDMKKGANRQIFYSAN
jgi:hypothetical protein